MSRLRHFFDMKEIAEALGYEFRYKGCICNGSPLHYQKMISGIPHKLIIYKGRGLWRLIKGSEVVLHGNESNINQMLKEYEDHQSH